MNAMLEYTYHHERHKKSTVFKRSSKAGERLETLVHVLPTEHSALFRLKRKTLALVLSHPRYLREQMQIRFIYKAFFRGRCTWVSQHVQLVEYALSGFPRIHYGVIKEYDHPSFMREPVAIVEFTNKSRYCMMLNEAGNAELRFTLNRTQLSILHLTCRNFSKVQISEILNSTTGAVYNNVKAIEKILKEKSWKDALGRVMASGILWELDESPVSN